MDLTRDGNERAFEAIVQRYRRPLLRYCSRLLSSGRAEDAVQQAFVSAHRAIHAGDAELNLRPWLYRIAHNSSLNLLRQHGFDHDQVSEEIDGVETPPQAFERHERLRSVVAAVQELPERQRSAIVLQAMEGRSYDEIAAELGVSEGAVRQLLNRARNTLREAAAALTPTGLLTRIAADGGEATVAERVAQVVAGAGGGAVVLKAGAALVVAGAVAGGAAGVAHNADPHVAAAPVATETRSVVPAGEGAHTLTGRPADFVRGVDGPGRSHGDRDSHRGSTQGRPGNVRQAPGENHHSGPGEDHHDSGDRSGPGSSEDHSGPGGGDDSSGGDDHSGSGSSGSGSSRSGSSDSGSSGSGSGDGSSGSGSSGSGSGDDSSGSGSSGSGSSGSGSGSGEPVTSLESDGSGSGSSGSGSDAPAPSDDGGHSGPH